MRIIVLDTETTGKERARDQVIEVGIQLGLDPMSEFHSWRIRPSVPIHPEATVVHGIRAEDLESCPSFAEVAHDVISWLSAADVIVGYNVAFDLDMLQAELERAKLPALSLAAKQVVDVLRLWHHVEPRTLAAAHEKFVGLPLTNAHSATADVAATACVLTSMLERFDLSAKTWTELAVIANPFSGREKWIGPSHHIQWDNGSPVFMFGKNKGVRVDAVDTGFLTWVCRQDFPAHVKEICQSALERTENLTGLLTAKYGAEKR